MVARLGVDLDPARLAPALVHRSWCAEHPGHDSNERLEFLGDAVLGVVVAEHVFAEFPAMPEAQMSKVRASVVSAAALSEIGASLDIGPGLRLGKGEAASGGRAKPSILADALEANIGAIYLDGGWGPARTVVLDLLSDPSVPPLPPHITLKQAKDFASSIARGDVNAWDMIKDTYNQVIENFLPHHHEA